MHSIALFTPTVRLPNCSICNEPVELETSKTDENGKAIHEECYVVKVDEKKVTLSKPSELSRLACSGTKEKALQQKPNLPSIGKPSLRRYQA